MAETYASDDTLNVIADHLLRALQADDKLKAGGDLEVRTWKHTLPDDIGEFQANLLPAVAAEVAEMRPASDEGFPDLSDYTYPATLLVVVAGGELAPVKRAAFRLAARIHRVLEQQHHPDKQLDNMPAAIDGGQVGSVRVRVTGLMAGGADLAKSSGLRGIAEIQADVTVGIVVPADA